MGHSGRAIAATCVVTLVGWALFWTVVVPFALDVIETIIKIREPRRPR